MLNTKILLDITLLRKLDRVLITSLILRNKELLNQLLKQKLLIGKDIMPF